MTSKWIYWFEELCSEQNDSVGRKCANLGELTRLGIRVPPGFAISVEGYGRFMELTGAGEEIRKYVRENVGKLQNADKQIEASQTIRGIIESRGMPDAMKTEVEHFYTELCSQVGMDRVPVAVRSSGAVSMPGQMDTFLNVLGSDEVCNNIVKVWGSAFTARAIAFRLEKGMKIEESPIGVAVLKMVNAKSAGVVLTVLPTTGDTSKVAIEGNWGLGEGVVNGEVNPDNFLVDKDTLMFDSAVNKKTRMVVYGKAGTTMTDVPKELQNQPCITREELLEIVHTSLKVEKHFNTPQDMEWVLDHELPLPNSLFWVQARPAKYTKKTYDEAEHIAELMTRLFRS
ncbi:MAG: PEP/pyruvate-binding domain-containing protein [Deltaproteobacteria bacterium]|nr:PEP/pyruvate-binding domain-containing protein [Deltaproteobacteria bacterium]